MRDLLLAGALLSAGVMLYLARLNVTSWIVDYHWRSADWAYAGLRLSWVVIVLVVAWAVLGVSELPSDWKTWLYTGTTFVGGVCGIVVATDLRRVKQKGRDSGHEEKQHQKG